MNKRHRPGGGLLPPRRSPQGVTAREPQPIGELIARVVEGAGLKGRGKLERLQPVWVEAVGTAHASQTRLVALRGGELVVEVASAALAHELGVYHKRALVERLRERSGLPIHDLRCKVGGPWPSPKGSR